MSTENNNTVSFATQGQLAADVYKDNPTTIAGYEPTKDAINDLETGLDAQVYENQETNSVVIAIAGTNDHSRDLDDGFEFIAGKLSDQTKQALEYVAKMISNARKDEVDEDNKTTFSVTGHSLGGAIAQIIASNQRH